jgi:hypothetical protein
MTYLEEKMHPGVKDLYEGQKYRRSVASTADAIESGELTGKAVCLM